MGRYPIRDRGAGGWGEGDCQQLNDFLYVKCGSEFPLPSLATSSLWFPLCLRSEALSWFSVRLLNKAKDAKTNIRLNISKYNRNSHRSGHVTTKTEHEFPNNFKQSCHRALEWDIDAVSGFTVGEGEGGSRLCPHQPYPITFQIVVIWMQSTALHWTTFQGGCHL